MKTLGILILFMIIPLLFARAQSVDVRGGEKAGTEIHAYTSQIAGQSLSSAMRNEKRNELDMNTNSFLNAWQNAYEATAPCKDRGITWWQSLAQLAGVMTLAALMTWGIVSLIRTFN